MYNIIYKNNFREQVCFTEWPYMVTDGDIFDGSYDEIENDDHIQGFEKKIQDKKLTIDICAVGGKAFQRAVDYIDDVAEKDIIAGQPGKLYVDSSYLNCYIIGTEKDRWINDIESISNELTIKTDYPHWITEVPYMFRKVKDNTNDSLGLDYEYDYEYEYAGDESIQHLVNNHYTDSSFRMVIYGPCINPAVRIAGHLYELQTTLYDGEYAVIDSSSRYTQERAIYKMRIDGTQISLFNSRNKDSEIWQKIPAGKSTVTWNGDFKFDITLFNERGTPLWTL